MRERHVLWDAITEGMPANPRTANQKIALYRFNLAALVERGWPPEYVEKMPLDMYEDILIIGNLIDAKRAKHS